MLPFIAQDGHRIMRAMFFFLDTRVMYAGTFYRGAGAGQAEQ